jgi:hypothetical protein
MSHFTTIKTQVRDLVALREACADLGLELVADTPCRGYADARRECSRTVRLKGPYDIAVDPSPEDDGSHSLTADWWNGHVEREVGTGFGRLLQAYGVRKTLREARSRGLRATRSREADGSILLTLEGGAL